MNVQIYDFNENLVTVPYFQLLQWRGAISLEAKGLKHSRGSVTQHVRRILSTPPRYDRKLLLEYLESCIADIKEQLQ